jgi:hypothetical protein
VEQVIISTDGAVSGRRAACAAVIAVNDRLLAEESRALSGLQGYALAAEVAGVALAARLAKRALEGDEAVTLEVDNPGVPSVIDGSYRPPGLHRIPPEALKTARDFCRRHRVIFKVLPRNSTPGLRTADRLAGQRLWQHRRARRPRP